MHGQWQTKVRSKWAGNKEHRDNVIPYSRREKHKTNYMRDYIS